MSIVLHCESTTCPTHRQEIIGVILDDGSLRQLVRNKKVHVHEGRATIGCRACGFEMDLVLPYPLPPSPFYVR